MNESYLQFRRPDRECLLCGTLLTEISRHPSVLKISEKDEAIREDFCPKCWAQLEHREYFSYWVTRRIQSGPSPEERRLAKSERNEALWALFNALYSRKSEELAPQLFLLAHLLMKYRVLAYLGPAEDGQLRFYHQATQETYLIGDLPLDQVSFVEVKEQVDGQLHEYAPSRESPAEES
ncbi:hypothetical protein HZA57_07280 [Candidatus Poribacteria bacterium]|nr:hypothetical protein [Candidatus Poribacteria bacterium]